MKFHTILLVQLTKKNEMNSMKFLLISFSAVMLLCLHIRVSADENVNVHESLETLSNCLKNLNSTEENYNDALTECMDKYYEISNKILILLGQEIINSQSNYLINNSDPFFSKFLPWTPTAAEEARAYNITSNRGHQLPRDF